MDRSLINPGTIRGHESVSKKSAPAVGAGALMREAPITSEFELQSELHLSRRTRVSGWKPCARDDPERSAAYLSRAAGLAEVRMVKEIEDFPAELKNLLLANLGALND